MTGLQILILPEPESLRLEEHRTPLLIYTDSHPEYSPGWVLLCLDDRSDLKSVHIPGGIEDVEEVAEAARDWLRKFGYEDIP